jgi:subtilisin family serine protease
VAPALRSNPQFLRRSFSVNPPNDQPGVLADHLAVSFHDGVTLEQVTNINSAIGASIAIHPVASNIYRIKLPASVDLEKGFHHYSNRPEVHTVLPAVEYGYSAILPDEDFSLGPNNRNVHTSIGLDHAWQAVSDRNGGIIGNYGVRVAVIDTGIDIAHRDIYMNIAINEREIPPWALDVIRQNQADMDPTISFIDLNYAPNRAVVPSDQNNNGYIDGEDLIAPGSPWLNGVDDDGNGHEDDLVGWNFGDRNNNTINRDNGHGTQVAGVLGAMAKNSALPGSGLDSAGAIWSVSIIPIRVFQGQRATSHEVHYYEGYIYSKKMRADVVNISMGHVWASEPATIPACVKDKKQVTQEIPLLWFNEVIRPNYKSHFQRIMAPHILYVFSAMNNGINLNDPNLFVTGQVAKSVFPHNTLLVGATNAPGGLTSMLNAADFSNYGSGVVDLWAPGTANWSLLPVAGAGIFSGTSAAAPLVSGVAALSLSYSRVDAQTLHDVLIQSADRRVLMSGCDGSAVGIELAVNALRALQ